MLVSECTTVTASYFPPLSAAASCSGRWVAPHSASSTSASMPQARAILWKRSLKAPFTRESTRRCAAFRMAPSIRPVAEEEEM